MAEDKAMAKHSTNMKKSILIERFILLFIPMVIVVSLVAARQLGGFAFSRSSTPRRAYEIKRIKEKVGGVRLLLSSTHQTNESVSNIAPRVFTP